MSATPAVPGNHRIVVTAALAALAWLAPVVLDRLTRPALGGSPFDWPWLALHFADVVVAASLLAALAGAVLWRRAPDAAAQATMRGALVLAALAFGVASVIKGATGLSSDVIAAGLLPTLDAESYFIGALDFFRTGQLTEWATRRPLATTHLVGLFAVTGQDLRLSLLLLAAGCAAAALLVTGPLGRAYGWAGACAGFAALFAFIYATLGATMSEAFGFTAGAVGFALLWLGADARRPAFLLGGLALLSLGLNARAGAFFVLPALALWIGWLFRRGRGLHWGWTAAAVAAAAVGFLATHLLIAQIGAPGQIAFSNFAHTLYGLAIGGEPWTRVFTDAPHLLSLPEGEQAKAIYRLALAHALDSPLDPVIGVLSVYNEFLFNMRWHAYVPNNGLRFVILVLAIAGILQAVRHRGEPRAALLLAGFAGIVLSVPFLGDGGSRVFAATHGFTAALVAAGAAALHARLRRAVPASAAETPAAEPASVIAWLLAATVILPLVVALTVEKTPPAAAAELTCAPSETALRAIAPRDGSVLICAEGADCAEGVRTASLRRTDIWKSPLVASLAAEAPVRAAAAIDARNGAGLRLLLPGGGAIPAGTFAACGVPRDGWIVLSAVRPAR